MESAPNGSCQGGAQLQYVIYFFLALMATTIGSATGMGGGVIMKPAMDILNDFDVETINLLSSLTVLSMAVVSVLKHLQNKTTIDRTIALPLAWGSILGGLVGDRGIAAIIHQAEQSSTVLLIQNMVLAMVLIIVFVSMRVRHQVKSLALCGVVPSLITGFLLGAISSFLGIGGGPLNIALIVFVFSMPIKQATIYSLVIILFAQLSKLVTVSLTGSLFHADLRIFPVLFVGAIVGGIVGSKINDHFSENKIEWLFQGAQVLIFLIVLFNIAQNLN